jgi:hypothetical protein
MDSQRCDCPKQLARIQQITLFAMWREELSETSFRLLENASPESDILLRKATNSKLWTISHAAADGHARPSILLAILVDLS